MTTTVVAPVTRPAATDVAPAWMAEWPLAHPRPTGDWSASGPLGWARVDPERGSLRRVDPADDRKLPALGPALRRGDLIGYRVGRRAVIAAGDVFVKVVRPSRVARLVGIHDAMAGTGTALEFSHVVATTEDGSVDLSVVRGRSLHDLLRHGADTDVIAAAADALAALHAVTPPAVLERGAPDTAARWVGTVARAERGAARSLMSLAAAVDGAVAAVSRRAGGIPPVVVHGDCHDKNVFLDRDAPAFIDLDGARLGLREEDVSNLAVHVALRALQAGAPVGVALARRDALVAAYGRSAPLDDAVLMAFERAVWFRLACLYRFRSTSRPIVPTLLDLARPPAL